MLSVMTHTPLDAIIIGAGAAGLSAAQMLGRARRSTLVIDSGAPRNRFATHAHGILGHDGVPPSDLYARGRAELEQYGVTVMIGDVTSVWDDGTHLHVETTDGTYAARTVILATGITDRLPDIPGLAERWGTTVLHCPYCHGWEVRDQRLGVLVSAPILSHLAQMVRQWSADVTVFTTDAGFLDSTTRRELHARDVTVIDSPLTSIFGDGTSISTVTTADGATHTIDALFAAGEPLPHDHMMASLDLARADTPFGSFIEAGPDGATSHARVWAAGNVVDPMASVPIAMASGATAGARANASLVADDIQAALEAQDSWPTVAPADFWEERYAGVERNWSGHVNPTLKDVVSRLTPGTAVDLGCGEGADVVWLAQHGWAAHGVDISPTAIARARQAAADAGDAGDGSATFEAADLSQWSPAQEYDLVAASFFHSPVSLERAEILRRASASVAPGGHLLLVTHAAPPPWAGPEHTRHHTFLTAREEADALGLDYTQWAELWVEDVTRDTTDPDGKPAQMRDGVVLLQRK